MILEIAAFVFVAFIAFAVGYFYSIHSLRKLLSDDEEYEEYDGEYDNGELAINPNKRSESHMAINIEWSDGYFFVYDKDTGKFMAHGKTRDEMEEALTDRFPDVLFAASEENLREVGFI